MTLDQITDWFDLFYIEYVSNKKAVRGRTFSGSHLEIWNRYTIVIVLHDPYLRGNTEESKAADLIKNCFDSDHLSLAAELDPTRFERIVQGQENLTEEDWLWPDE